MSYLISFFKWIWDGIKSVFSLVFSIPTLIFTAATSIISGIAGLVQTLSSSSTVVQAISSHGDSVVNSINGFVADGGSWLQLLFYILSMDLLFQTILSLVTIFITFTLAIVTFLTIAVPAFIIQWYALKLSAFVASALLPSQYLPYAVKQFGNFKGVSFHRVLGSSFSLEADFDMSGAKP